MRSVSNEWLLREMSENFGMNTTTWTFSLRNEIDRYTLYGIKVFLDLYRTTTPKPKVKPKLVVTCVGGEVLETFGIVDLLNEYNKLYKIKVDVDVYGYAMSAAVLLVACATGERRISKNSLIMIHQVRNTSFDDNLSAKNLEAKAATGKKLQDTYLNLLREKTTISEDIIRSSLSDDTYLFSDDVVKFKIADKII